MNLLYIKNMESKTDLRTRFKTARKQLDILKISRNIEENIRALDFYQKSKSVMLFYPTEYEINLLGLLNDKNKNFYFPKVNKSELLVCPYSEGTEFKKSGLNINEPCSFPVNPDVLDFIIVPALAADRKNYRLGYGGGFYDRFLKLVPNAVKIVPVHEMFVIEELPIEDFDVPVDLIVTDAKKARV